MDTTDGFYQLTDLDDEIMGDFMGSLNDSIDDIEADLERLDAEPNDQEAVHSLFRAMHSIKGNARMCFIEPLTDYAHAIEDVISQVRAGKMRYSLLIKQTILLSLDHYRLMAEELALNKQIDTSSINEIGMLLSILKDASDEQVSEKAKAIVTALGGEALSVTSSVTPQAISSESTETPAPDNLASEEDKDIAYFRQLSEMVDGIYIKWAGRTQQIANFCRRLNRALNQPVDENQLLVAVYMHDVGMAFISEAIVTKDEALSESESVLLQRHPRLGYEFLVRIPRWQQAAEIVHQHHEHIDGSGYPRGLSGAAVSKGAQLVALADTFFELTNARADLVLQEDSHEGHY